MQNGAGSPRLGRAWLAEKAGISPNTVARFENEKNKFQPSRATVKLIQQAFESAGALHGKRSRATEEGSEMTDENNVELLILHQLRALDARLDRRFDETGKEVAEALERVYAELADKAGCRQAYAA